VSKKKKTEFASIDQPPPVELMPMPARSPSSISVISGSFLGDLQRHYERVGYKVFDQILETNPLEYFKALVQLSKVTRIQAEVTHRDGEKPRSVEEILDKVEQRTGKEGRAAFMQFLMQVKPYEG
jgi:hypothetical protein